MLRLKRIRRTREIVSAPGALSAIRRTYAIAPRFPSAMSKTRYPKQISQYAGISTAPESLL